LEAKGFSRRIDWIHDDDCDGRKGAALLDCIDDHGKESDFGIGQETFFELENGLLFGQV
jgi:hypothetical protein